MSATQLVAKSRNETIPAPAVYKTKKKPKPRLPFTDEEVEALSKPRVLIVGGGLGGLTLAILLHKANIPFLVFERAHKIKPLGSAIALGANICPLFQQMGIYDDFIAAGKHHTGMSIFSEELKPLFSMECEWAESITNYRQYIISRPDLYNILWRHLPVGCVHLGKRVLSFKEVNDLVTIQCSDNSSYHGEILVGADGAYSAVRQHLYKNLKIDNKLPSRDDVDLPFGCVCLVGQTIPLDPEEFPALKNSICDFNSVLGTWNRCTWITFTTKQNTVCWMVIQFLNKHTSKMNDSFRNSEWGIEQAEALCREVRVFKVPGLRNGEPITLGDYIDKSPKESIAKVMLEEIVFDTWHGGRVVLMGDACHKMNPTGGVGATIAMHDAVTLANWISTLSFPNVKDLNRVFKEYKAERYPVAKDAFESSQMFTKNLGKNSMAVLIRACMKRMPLWLWKRIGSKILAARCQASFLPEVEDNARLKPLYQPSLHKTRAILKKKAEEKEEDALERSLEATV